MNPFPPSGAGCLQCSMSRDSRLSNNTTLKTSSSARLSRLSSKQSGIWIKSYSYARAISSTGIRLRELTTSFTTLFLLPGEEKRCKCHLAQTFIRDYTYIGDWTDSVLPIVRPNQRRRPMGHGGQLGHQVWHAPQKVLPRDFLLRVKVIIVS